MKLLTNREMELLNLAVHYAVQLDHCNPEVGMGPSRQMIVDRVAAQLSFAVDPDDLAEIGQEISGQDTD
jgi:hypothetical protein